MEREEYGRMYRLEDSFWFYVSLHSLVLRVLEKHISTPPDARLLDAGCGTGGLLRLMGQRGVSTGVDISSEALKYAKRRELKNLAMASVTELPFRENSFDLITSMDVLYHRKINDDNAALREFNRVLKHSGILVISVAALKIMEGEHDKVVHTRKRYRMDELERKLEESGFEIIKGSYRLFFLSFPVLLTRFAGRLLKGCKPPASDLRPLPPLVNTLLTRLQLFENRLLEYVDLPFGPSLFFVLKKIR